MSVRVQPVDPLVEWPFGLQSIVEDVFDLPGGKPISQDLVQPISRLADAYVDSLEGKGTVSVTLPVLSCY